MAIAERENLRERIRELQGRLAEAEETLNAIRSGEVDAVVVSGPGGDQVYTLKGADEVYRLLMQEMAEGAVTLTAEGLILFANHRFAEIVKVPPERVAGARFQEFLLAGEEEAFAALLKSTLREGAKGELQLQAADGRPVPAYLSLNRLQLDNVPCVCLMLTDLTEQKRSQAMVAAERLARSILEQAAETIVVVDPEGRILRASRAAHRLAGENVLLRRFDDVYRITGASLAGWGSYREIFSAVSGGQLIESVECNLVVPGERVVDVLVSAAPLAGANSELLGSIVTLTNISERKRIEAELRQAHETVWSVIQGSPLPMGLLDPDGKVRLWNLAAERVFGWTPQEVLGRLPPQIPEAGLGRFFEMLEQVRRGEPVLEAEVARKRKDGSGIDVRFSVSGLRGPAGEVTGFIVLAADLTEQRRMEAQLREKQRLETVGLLAGGIAHDFNNLLTGILGNASLALEGLPAYHPAVERLQGVLSAGQRAADLTRQLLAYAGKGRFVLEPVNVSKSAGEIAELLQSSISKRVELRLELTEDLPAVEADVGQIDQLLMNLVMNAAEAADQPGGRVLVRTGLQEVDAEYIGTHPAAFRLVPGAYVRIEVTDNGCGMDEATLARIFDPFFTTKFTGRGLGLSAVQGIVQSHRGAIQVDSAPGKGTTFVVLLPALAARLPAEPVPAPKGVRATGTVLLVDDERAVREVAQAALEHCGYTVLAAENGQRAAEVFREQADRICGVVLDLTMPVMGGEETLQELQAIRPEVKVLLMSGYSETEAMRHFAGRRVSGFIQKPYTAWALAEKLRSTLAGE